MVLSTRGVKLHRPVVNLHRPTLGAGVLGCWAATARGRTEAPRRAWGAARSDARGAEQETSKAAMIVYIGVRRSVRSLLLADAACVCCTNESMKDCSGKGRRVVPTWRREFGINH